MLGWLILFLMIWIPFKLVTWAVYTSKKRRYLEWYKKVCDRRNELYLEGMWPREAMAIAREEFADSEPPWVICDTSKVDQLPSGPWKPKEFR